MSLSSFTPLPLKKTEAFFIVRKQDQQTVEVYTADGRFASGADAVALEKSLRQAGHGSQELPLSHLVLPTGLDLQVHLRYPGQPEKETLEGGLESALLGGYDSIVTMPNTNPFIDSPEELQKAIQSSASIRAKYPVRVGFTAAGTKGMQGQEATHIEKLAAAGAVAITDDGWGVKSDEAMDRIFAACAEHDLLFQQHAEMPGHKGVATASEFQRSNGFTEYPRSAESEMIRRDLRLLQKYPKARYHVLHVSTRESLEEIRRAKEKGLPVSAEVTPHHLFFSTEEIPAPIHPLSTSFKMNPPLFAPEDREALREALKSGLIDCVSTDHAPHESHLKAKGWQLCPFGTRGLETALPALLTLYSRGVISLERLKEVFCFRPRALLGREEFRIPTGLVFVDPKRVYTVTEGELPGISKNSCFLGTTLTGRVEARLEKDGLYLR